MTDVLKLGKKIFTFGVVVTTIMWSLGVATLAPSANAASCPALSAGDMIKVSGKPAIYAVNNVSKVLYFPSGDEFKSWNVNDSYGGYVTVTQDCFDSLSVPSTYPGAVNYRAGSFIVKRPSSDQLYVVEPGNTLAKISVTDAKALYGATYKVMTVQDAFWPHYVNRGADIAGLAHQGMLVSKDSKTWYVDAGNVLREVTATGMTANRFKAAFVRAVPASYLAGFTTGAVIDALNTTISNRTQDGALSTTPVTGGNLTVALAADNPAATNIADGSAYNSVLKLNLSAGSATKVNGITLTRTGLISNTKITGVSVWDSQGNRHGDVMTSFTSDNKVTVSFAGNPILVSSGAPETLTVKLNIAADATSGLVGMQVTQASDISSDGTVGGSFPITGNQMSIIDGNASLAAVTVSNVAVGGLADASKAVIASANVSIGDVDKQVAQFKFTETSGNEDVVISKLTFYFEGTLQDKDLTNIRVYAPDGSVLGSVSSLTDRYATVNFSNAYTLPKSSNRTLTVKADIINGSTHYFRVHLQNDYDMLLKGSSTGFYVLPTSFTDTVETAGWFEMKSGSLTVNKNVASPAGNVSAGASSIVLGTFDIKAVGEDMEIRKMGLGVVTTTNIRKLTGNITVKDSNGNVYLTVAASGATLYSPTAGGQNNLSSYLTIKSGETKTLQVVGNIDSNATSVDTYQVGIGNFYAKRLATLDFVDNLPTAVSTSTLANQLTVSATSLTCYKDTSMGNVTRATGSSVVIAQYICSAGTSEDVRLTSVGVNFQTSGGPAIANTYQNVALYDGSTQLGSTLSTVASSSNSFSFESVIAKGTTKTLQVKAFIVAGSSGTVTSSLSSYNYSGKDSGTSNTGALVVGQSVTVGAGKLAVAAASDATTISKVYGPNQTGVQLGKWKLSAASDSINLNKITLKTRNSAASDATTLGNFGTLSLYDGSTLLGTGNYVAGDVVFNGLTLSIPMDTNKVLTLKANTNGSGVITRNTAIAFVVKSDSSTDMEARSGAGALLTTSDIAATTAGDSGATTDFATSTNYIFHDAYPTITAPALGSALPLDTKAQIFKFTITNSGAVDLRFASTSVSVSVSGLAGVGATSGTIRDFRLYEDNGSGGLGTYLAVRDTVVNSSTANPATITFDVGQAATTGSMDNLTVNPGASRTFIVTADTSNMGTNKTTGTSVTLSAKIGGSTGWSGSAWNTGSLLYYYTPAGSTTEVGNYSASDSYEVSGSTMTRSF